MAEELLVGEQLTPEMTEAGHALLALLDKRSLSVQGAFWMKLPEQFVWRLFVVSPHVGAYGPKAMYRSIRSAYTSAKNVPSMVGTKDISVLDVRAPLFMLLRSAITVTGISGVRFSRNIINGTLIEDAYIYRLT